MHSSNLMKAQSEKWEKSDGFSICGFFMFVKE